VADVEAAFSSMWEALGMPLPEEERFQRAALAKAGDAALRVIATVPNRAGLYRLDQLVAAVACRTLWLTDAYFIGSTMYVQALRSAARDGVDVRLLVPDATDIPILRGLSRAGYEPLLEAGVRVYEWNGPMIHAKTAVADRRWARVGSTNLNFSSWMGNYELDVAIEDDKVAVQMEAMYLEDLENATEIVLRKPYRVRPVTPRRRQRYRRPRGTMSTKMGRAGASAARLSNIVSASITNHRLLGPAEARFTGVAGLVLVLFALAAILVPRVVTVPIAFLSAWIGFSLIIRTYRLLHRKPKEPGERG
jgi:cardiolipin synthase A/B